MNNEKDIAIAGEPRNKYGFCIGSGEQRSSEIPVLTKDDMLRYVMAAGVTTAHIGGD